MGRSAVPRLVFNTDTPKQLLPRALPPDVDYALMAAVADLSYAVDGRSTVGGVDRGGALGDLVQGEGESTILRN